MNLKEASAYQDSLDAVESGKFTSVQSAEVEAVVVGVQEYLAKLSSNISMFKSVMAQLTAINPDLAQTLTTSMDGPQPLPAARVSL